VEYDASVPCFCSQTLAVSSLRAFWLPETRQKLDLKAKFLEPLTGFDLIMS
jgi:hypothetical protein